MTTVFMRSSLLKLAYVIDNIYARLIT